MVPRLLLLFAAAVLTVEAGCADGDDIDPGRSDSGVRRDGSGGGGDSSGGCFPPCGSGETCRAGRCVPEGVDNDGDGVGAAVDCDDTDPTVGRVAERSCSGPCGTGVERCTDGAWDPCNAPTDCDCEPGAAPRTVPCERCGMQRQICVGGRWENDGPCSSGECSPGEIQMGASCGRCGREQRSCRTDCSWSDYVCAGESGECLPGEIDMMTEACGACGEGTRSRSRTCSSTCVWGAFGTTGACMTDAQCAPGERDTESRACGCMMAGTETRTRSCDSTTCRWGSFGSWSSCSASSSCCGDGMCSGGETCSSCSDCQAGHLGSGENGDPCPAYAEGQWRCVTIPSYGTRGSQVCRSGRWVTFNLNPMGCSACVCTFSTACCAPGSPSSGC